MRPTRYLPAALLTATVLASGGCTADSDATDAQPTAETPQAAAPAVDGDQAAGIFARIPDIVERVEPSVVTIAAGDGLGSGVVYEPDVVITNAHVVGDVDRVTVTLANGVEIPGAVRATDTVTDLAVVDVERDLSPVEFEEDLPRVGELVIAMGSPLGFENSVAAGIVSGLGREIPGSARQSRALVDLVQTDAAISPGNSGGALVNASGQVVGINEAYIPPQAGAVSLGFAIPAATVVDTVEELLADGTATHPFVGIAPGRLTPQLAEALGLEADSGVLVLEVVADGPAAAAGIQRGDVITEFQGAEVASVEEFLGQLRDVEPGDTVEVGLLRDGEPRTVSVEIGQLESGA